ncbi:MAG TPA: DinB family protein [Streptosporangiaceae bacterium]|jgi:hypothetical protein
MELDWSTLLAEQLEGHWAEQLRPRLAGLTDEEYFWEPVPGCWSVRPRGQATTSRAGGTGEYVWEFEWPAPDPPPVTTIAWRFAHITVGVFAQRNAAHFGGQPADHNNFEYAGSAAEALRKLDEAHAAWMKGVRDLGADGLRRPCGPAEGPFADHPLAALVQHINREAIHHGAEVALLRDLYVHREK